MSRRWAPAAWLASLLLALGPGCSPAPGRETVRGIVVDVDGVSLQRLAGFTLRTADGQELVFKAAPGFNAGVAHAMTPGHLRQHMALAEPVEVIYQRASDGTLLALSATDVSGG